MQNAGQIKADPEVWNVLGEKIVCKVKGSDTFGRFAVVEETSPPLNVMFSYVHRRTEKIFYVLEGKYEAFIGDKTFLAAAGDTIPVPRGTAHHFRNLLPTPSRLLIFITPGGFENFFAETSMLRIICTEEIARIGEKYDFEFEHSKKKFLRHKPEIRGAEFFNGSLI